MIKAIFYICILTVILILSGCTKSKRCYYQGQPPSFFFQIRKDGEALSADILNRVKLSYINVTGQKQYVADIAPAIDHYEGKGILVTRDAAVFSADQLIKDYIIEYPDNLPSDRLFLDFETYNLKNNCQYAIKGVKFNDQVASFDPSFMYQKVYVVNK